MSCGSQPLAPRPRRRASTAAPRPGSRQQKTRRVPARRADDAARARGSRALRRRPGTLPVELGAESRAAASRKRRPRKASTRDQRGGAGMLESPDQFPRRREGADRAAIAPILAAPRAADDPFGAVGDQQRHAIAATDADGEQRPGELVDARGRRGAGRDAGRERRRPRRPAGPRPALRSPPSVRLAAARSRGAHRVIRSGARASRGTRRCPRRSGRSPAPRRRVPAPAPRA